MKSFDEYKNATVTEGDQRQDNGGIAHVKLKAPLVDIYKVNWDVAIDKTHGHMGVGIIGDVIAAKSLTKLRNLEQVCS